MNWKKIIEKNEENIREAAYQACIAAAKTNGAKTDMRFEVQLYADGRLTTGYLGQNQTDGEVWNGLCYPVFSIHEFDVTESADDWGADWNEKKQGWVSRKDSWMFEQYGDGIIDDAGIAAMIENIVKDWFDEQFENEWDALFRELSVREDSFR